MWIGSPSERLRSLLFFGLFSKLKNLRSEDHTFHFLNSVASEDSGKLYVTNSVFSNGIGGLWSVILHVFFLSVKPFEQQLLNRKKFDLPFVGSPPSLCNNLSGL